MLCLKSVIEASSGVHFSHVQHISHVRELTGCKQTDWFLTCTQISFYNVKLMCASQARSNFRGASKAKKHFAPAFTFGEVQKNVKMNSQCESSLMMFLGHSRTQLHLSVKKPHPVVLMASIRPLRSEWYEIARCACISYKQTIFSSCSAPPPHSTIQEAHDRIRATDGWMMTGRYSNQVEWSLYLL
jgi:hypothetical protein